MEALIPKIDNVKELKKFLRPLYIIEDYMDSPKSYKNFCFEIRDIVRATFTKKDCREYPVRFKFYAEDKKEHKLELRVFLYNIYLWLAVCELKGIHVLDETFILQPEDIPNLTDFENEKIIKCMRDYNVKQIKINYYISEINALLRSISLDFSDLMNLTFTDETFFDMYENEEYRKLMTLSFPENAQPVEIEAILNTAQAKLVDLLRNDKTNPIGVILRSGTGIKHKQLVEFLIAMGMKPTLTGETMPIVIENSSLIGGLDRPSYMYIDATGARKPLIMNARMMGNAGYFGKKMEELAGTVVMSKTTRYCDTKHLVKYIVRTKKHLKKLAGKFYVESLSDDDYKVLKDTDTHLIGQTIYCRSAATCNCGQNEICPVCIGENASLLMDIANGIGIFFSQEAGKDLEQNILSSKHLLTTNSEKIEFTKEFYTYFTIMSGEINLALPENVSRDDLAIHVDMNDVFKKEEYDDDSTYNTYIASGKFDIVNMKTGEIIEISIKNDKEIYVVSEMAAIMRQNNGYIKLKDIDDDARIFEVIILNNELTKPLYDLMNILDKNEKADMDEVDIDTVSQRILDIFVDAGIGAQMVSGELILNRLIRKSDNVMRRPDFSYKRMPDYKIYRISKVLEYNGSPLVGLSFEQLKRQLLNPNLKDRTDTSFLDANFKERLSTEALKKYSRVLEE